MQDPAGVKFLFDFKLFIQLVKDSMVHNQSKVFQYFDMDEFEEYIYI